MLEVDIAPCWCSTGVIQEVYRVKCGREVSKNSYLKRNQLLKNVAVYNKMFTTPA